MIVFRLQNYANSGWPTKYIITAALYEVNIISVWKEWMWNVTLAVVMSGMYHVETETGEWVVP